jgi:Uncharacterised protein conserved in bacteria (DUF2336)
MSGSALSDLSGLLALSREHALDLRPVILRVQTDLFAGAAARDREMIAAFEALASGLLPAVDDETAAIIAEKLAPIADTPESVLVALVERGGEARRVIIERAPILPEHVVEIAARDGADLSSMQAARADLGTAEAVELVSRQDRHIDLALARNAALVLSAESLEALVQRGRKDGQLAKALLARPDLPAAHRAALYLDGDSEQRAAIRTVVSSIAAIRFGSLPPPEREGAEVLVDLSMAGDRERFAAQLSSLLRLDRVIAWDFAREERHDLLPLALAAAGLADEDVIRIILTLEPAIALSMQEVFRLVRLFRDTERATAAYLVEAILGAATRSQPGRHIPHTQAGSLNPRPTTSEAARELATTLRPSTIRQSA